MIGEIGNGEYLDRGVFSYRRGGREGEEIAVEKQWKIDENEGMVRTTRDEFSRE